MIRRAVKWFLVGYLAAAFLNVATGWSEWRTVLDLLNAVVLGFQLTSGFRAEALILDGRALSSGFGVGFTRAPELGNSSSYAVESNIGTKSA